MIWCIWELRNKVIFEKQSVNWEAFVLSLFQRWRCWISKWLEDGRHVLDADVCLRLSDPFGSGYCGSHFELQFRGWGYQLGHIIVVGGFICIWFGRMFPVF